MSTMNDYALYRMYDTRRAELEREARETALIAGISGRRRWWLRKRRTSEVAAAGSVAYGGAVLVPAQRADEPTRHDPAATSTTVADHRSESARAGRR